MSEEKTGNTRRDFLKKAAPLTGAAIFSGAALVGCTGPSGITGPTGSPGPQGEAGSDGSKWHTGSGAPAATVGSDGDLYLNTDDGSVWQKANSTWKEVDNITGPKGDKGDKGDAASGGGTNLNLPMSVPPSKGVLVVDKELCFGCGVCTLACSLANEGVGSMELGRIQKIGHNNYTFDAYVEPCMQCVDPQCMRVCPTGGTGALKVDPVTGARVIDEKFCVGCQKCIQHCIYDPPRIFYNKTTKKAFKCDLCGGDPACVKACPSGALKYYTNPDGVNTGFTPLGLGIGGA